MVITWTNIVLWSIKSSNIHLMWILHFTYLSYKWIHLKITYLQFRSSLPGINELKGILELWECMQMMHCLVCTIPRVVMALGYGASTVWCSYIIKCIIEKAGWIINSLTLVLNVFLLTIGNQFYNCHFLMILQLANHIWDPGLLWDTGYLSRN